MMPMDLGFLGGGQLARMSIQAAQRMGLSCLSLDPDPKSPASQIGPAIQGALNDAQAVAKIVGNCQRITLENEFIPAGVIAAALEQVGRTPDVVIPGLDTLATIQDKLRQREALHRAGVPSPLAIELSDDAAIAVARLGYPLVLKARFGGYDGKGTLTIRDATELEDTRPRWSDGGWLAEAFVPFERELAVMVVRTPTMTAVFPTMETVQSHHVCDLVFPATADASAIAIAAVEAVNGFGIFGVELFEEPNGRLSVNELAPRPHNTGHFSLDWGGVSQFDQHVRAVMGLPLAAIGGQPTCMANLMGQPNVRDWRRGLAAALSLDPDIRVHWYGKVDSRPGRKMGHLNAVGPDAKVRAVAARGRFYRAWVSNIQDTNELGVE